MTKERRTPALQAGAGMIVPSRLSDGGAHFCVMMSSIIEKEKRAGDGIRTHDLLLGKETFYH